MRLDIADMLDWTVEQAQLANNCKIYLNGEEVKYVTVADEEQGYIERYKELDGKFVREGDEIAIERLEGEVQIIDKRNIGVLHA